MYQRALIAAVWLAVTTVSPALSDDWKVISLQGEALTFHAGHWNRLTSGEVVSDDSVIRTRADARVQFQRDRETIDVGPETQIQKRFSPPC